MDQANESFAQLLTIMKTLRENCPWDRKQTLESLRYLTIEETYELSDAILSGDMGGIKKELGDLLLHIVFYARIGAELEAFDMKDVIDSINEKLITRHPHIYGDVTVKDAKEVKDNWEKIKLKDKENKSVLAGVPSSLPALVKAYRIQEKASGVGFDWDHPGQVWEKVEEELKELQKEVEEKAATEAVESEFGDLLFALINYARFIGVNPEDALEKTNRKFIHRFTYLEQEARKRHKPLHEMTLKEMDVFWNEAKQHE